MSKILSFIAFVVATVSLSLSVYTSNTTVKELTDTINKQDERIKVLEQESTGLVNRIVELENAKFDKSFMDVIGDKAQDVNKQLSEGLDDFTKSMKKNAASVLKDLSNKIEESDKSKE